MIKDEKLAKEFNPVRESRKGMDQHFLYSVYLKIKANSLIHDSHLCLTFRDSVPWPTQRKGNCFVGSAELCSESEKFKFECNVKCRPKDHQDWTAC
jgi:hypothetical protein